MDAIFEILRLGSVGILSGLFSAYLALRGHRNRKWWELRVEAYQSVIEALSDLTHYYDEKFDDEIQRREISQEREAELKQFWDSSYHSVRKAADSVVFLFSESVNQALREFIDLRNEHYKSFFDYIDSHSAVAKKCLETVVGFANKDLRVNDTWI
jgi:uncharacterized Ntn-hydrolase superfamily protein